ncbi:hypothetical protein NW767_015473 [Fusarium falciforme]|nr:hypothetical protein NW767_015473 [Fusarium falciforme]
MKAEFQLEFTKLSDRMAEEVARTTAQMAQELSQAKDGRYGALWEVMIGMEYLLNFFEEQKLIFSPPDGTANELQMHTNLYQ